MAATGKPRIVVFGGNGFIGSEISRAAVQRGCEVISVSRKGKPLGEVKGDLRAVNWVKGDVFDAKDEWTKELKGATAVISCIGGFGNNAQMLKINGTANETLVQLAKDNGVDRFVYVSAFPFTFMKYVIPGYMTGKQHAEHAVERRFGDKGVVLRPGFVYGPRVVSDSGFTLPLQYILGPMRYALRSAPARYLEKAPVVGPWWKAIMVPPISARTLAIAAVEDALEPSVPRVQSVDVMEELAAAAAKKSGLSL